MASAPKEDNAPAAVVALVPPLVMAKTPVIPEVKGKPVAFVKIAAEGVPKSGVTKLAEVALTTSPDPVVAISSTTPAPVETRPNTLPVVTFCILA